MADIAEVWRRGSVVSSWLLNLSAQALVENPSLNRYTGFVQDSGEGRWTVMAAVEEAVPADVLSAALYTRFRVPSRAHICGESVVGDAGKVRWTRRGAGIGEARVSMGDKKGEPAGPCVVVVFGATGNLNKRKLLPAIYNLQRNDLLPDAFTVLGAARKPASTESFRREMREDIGKYATQKIDEAQWAWLEERLQYQNHLFQLLALTAMKPPTLVRRRGGARREVQDPQGD